MLKKISLFILGILFLVIGFLILTPQEEKIEKFSLDEEYYHEGVFLKKSAEEINALEHGNYVLYTYNSFCSFSIPCDTIFSSFMKKYKIDFLSIPYDEFQQTSLFQVVKYAPSILLVHDGRVMSYLDAESNQDLEKYQDVSKFEEWVLKYILLKN